MASYLGVTGRTRFQDSELKQERKTPLMSSKKILLLIASGVLAALLLQRSVIVRRKPKRRLTEQTELPETPPLSDETARTEADKQAIKDAARIEVERLKTEEETRLEADSQAETGAFREDETRRQLPDATGPRPVPKTKTPEQTVVMVTDDSKVVRVKTGRLLTAHNYQVVMAEDGLDAVRQIENAIPDLLITDLDMPGMGGMELVRHLRGHGRTVDIPIIMITSDNEALRKEAEESGVNVVLGKPYPEEELIAQIQLLLTGQSAG